MLCSVTQIRWAGLALSSNTTSSNTPHAVDTVDVGASARKNGNKPCQSRRVLLIRFQETASIISCWLWKVVLGKPGARCAAEPSVLFCAHTVGPRLGSPARVALVYCSLSLDSEAGQSLCRPALASLVWRAADFVLLRCETDTIVAQAGWSRPQNMSTAGALSSLPVQGQRRCASAHHTKGRPGRDCRGGVQQSSSM